MRMVPRRTPAIVIAAIAFVSPAFADPASAEAPYINVVNFDLRQSQAAIVTFEVSAGHDIEVDALAHACRVDAEGYHSLIGMAWFFFEDGDLSTLERDITAASIAWQPGADQVDIGAFGISFRPSTPLASDRCRAFGNGFSLGRDASSSVTVVAMAMAPNATVRLIAQTNSPLQGISVDFVDGLAKTKSEFSQGAHGGVYPVPTSAGASVLLEETQATAGPSIGWFWPDTAPSGAIMWSCESSGIPCEEPSASGLIVLRSSIPTTWKATVLAGIDSEPPYYALGVIPLHQ